MLNNAISEIFSESPIKALQQHIGKVCACFELLPTFFAAILINDARHLNELYRHFLDLDQLSSQIKKKLRLALLQDMFLALPKNEIAAMLHLQSQLGKQVRQVVELFFRRKMQLMPELASVFQQYIQALVVVVLAAGRAIKELDALIETGFHGHELQVLGRIIVELDQHESTAYELLLQVREVIFQIETQVKPVDAIFLYRALDILEEILQHACRLGHRLEFNILAL
jgi:predicted phosphate transport protein (TIGR00153 family)